MRKIVLQMMTTLNGRLDDLAAWVHDVVDDQYREIDRIYSTFDTVLVGRTTYEEMAAYWPRALAEHAGTETNQVMAERMNTYRKLVFSRSGDNPLTEWADTEQVIVATDDELVTYLENLKRQPGKDIHPRRGTLSHAVPARRVVRKRSGESALRARERADAPRPDSFTDMLA
ncbi:dihydrofolate reductase family protein [Rhodococcus opacus]|uniref:dihydrofolate reductase family protein n=1 Tax=Rhodococcus opacus TaxID=37919 RepID=UPI001F541F48|nr:dihydrofolate reductase family protein [Rhodococcus opacus]